MITDIGKNEDFRANFTLGFCIIIYLYNIINIIYMGVILKKFNESNDSLKFL